MISLIKRLVKGSLMTAQELDGNWTQLEDQVNLNITAIEDKVDKEGTKVLSDENFTTSRANKLDNLEENWKGRFETSAGLLSAYPNPNSGWGAIIGDTGTVWAVSDQGTWYDTQSSTFGDMNTVDYDPTGKATDAFSMASMDETPTKKVLTKDERDLIATITNKTESTDVAQALTDYDNDVPLDRVITLGVIRLDTESTNDTATAYGFKYRTPTISTLEEVSSTTDMDYVKFDLTNYMPIGLTASAIWARITGDERDNIYSLQDYLSTDGSSAQFRVFSVDNADWSGDNVMGHDGTVMWIEILAVITETGTA